MRRQTSHAFDSTLGFETVQLGFDCNHRNSFLESGHAIELSSISDDPSGEVLQSLKITKQVVAVIDQTDEH